VMEIYLSTILVKNGILMGNTIQQVNGLNNFLSKEGTE
jgi:hypothetical protein